MNSNHNEPYIIAELKSYLDKFIMALIKEKKLIQQLQNIASPYLNLIYISPIISVVIESISSCASFTLFDPVSDAFFILLILSSVDKITFPLSS